MSFLKISGGKPLEGTIKIPGAKNAVTKLLVASLLTDKKCIFFNVPSISDVETTVALCEELGSEVVWDKEKKILEIQTKELKTTYIPQRFSGANRIPILMIGALLGRTDQDVIIPTVGGCNLGKRPVDFHIQALEKLGAQIELRSMKKEGAYFARAHQGLKGTSIELAYPSVGATENTILAAVRAQGTTWIKNAAIEPEIVDLILFLQKLGAIISIEYDRSIKITGTHQFYEVRHEVISDRNVAASFGMAAIATQGKIFVEGAQHQHLIGFLNKLREVGAGFNIHPNGIEFFHKGPLQGGLHVETDVHPGFMTDWQQPFTVLLTQAQGTSIVHETVYEERFGYIQTLKKMGANIGLFKDCLGGKSCRFCSNTYDHSAVIHGATPLQGHSIQIPDLRAGFAYIMAALVAEGTSVIEGLPFVERGYENLIESLQSLGASAEKMASPLNSIEESEPKAAQALTRLKKQALQSV